MAEAVRPRRRRWLVGVLVVILLALGGAALLLRHFLQPDQLTALLVKELREQAGVDLVLGKDARFGFIPNLHLRLPQTKLRAIGASNAFLDAAAIDVIVPWASIRTGHYDIERLDLEQPRLDLDALAQWFAASPGSNTALPSIRIHLRVRDGVLVSAGAVVAEGIDLDLDGGSDILGWLAQWQPADVGTDVSLLPPLVAGGSVRRVQLGATRIDGIRITISDAPPATAAEPASK